MTAPLGGVWAHISSWASLKGITICFSLNAPEYETISSIKKRLSQPPANGAESCGWRGICGGRNAGSVGPGRLWIRQRGRPRVRASRSAPRMLEAPWVAPAPAPHPFAPAGLAEPDRCCAGDLRRKSSQQIYMPSHPGVAATAALSGAAELSVALKVGGVLPWPTDAAVIGGRVAANALLIAALGLFAQMGDRVHLHDPTRIQTRLGAASVGLRE